MLHSVENTKSIEVGSTIGDVALEPNASIEAKSPGGFVELIPYPKKPSAGVHIHIGNGFRIEVERDFDPVTLRAAIQAVQG